MKNNKGRLSVPEIANLQRVICTIRPGWRSMDFHRDASDEGKNGGLFFDINPEQPTISTIASVVDGARQPSLQHEKSEQFCRD